MNVTPREIDIIRLAARGWDNARIARGLCIAVQTVRNHMKCIFDRTGCSSRVQVVMMALQEGLIRLDDVELDEPRPILDLW